MGGKKEISHSQNRRTGKELILISQDAINYQNFQILCTTCFVLVLTNLSIGIYRAVKVLTLVVCTTFLFLTFVDTISWLVLYPMTTSSWVMIAVAGVSMFWITGGFLLYCIRIGYMESILFVGTPLAFITGFVFLLEFFTIIW